MPNQETSDNLTTNPFEAVICLLATISIINVIQIMPQLDMIPADQKIGILGLPEALIWVWLISGLIGSVLMLVGLCTSSFTWLSRMIEEVGLWLSLGMWSSLAVADAITFPEDWSQYVGYLGVAVGCGLRLYALHRVKMAVQKVAELMRREGREEGRT
jgi:hypothetical protein